jgi:hypothetical protein
MPIQGRVSASLRLLVAVVTAFTSLFALGVSSALAAETKTFTGVKNCSTAVTVSPPAPGGYCVITESSLTILEDAKVYYTDATVVPTLVGGILTNVLNSPVTLRATDERGSTATGHCTYNFANATTPGHGVCMFWSGSSRLVGFHANEMVGAPTFPGSGVFPIAGTYWFDRDHQGDDGDD